MHKFIVNFTILLLYCLQLIFTTEAAKLRSSSSVSGKRKGDKRIYGNLAVPITNINDYPWLASLQIGTNNEATGMIVGKHWILTLASEGKRLSSIVPLGAPVKVVYGSIDVSASNSANYKVRKVKGTGYKFHPNYNETDNSFPFALVRVCPGFESTQIFAPLGMLNPVPVAEGASGDALGWHGDQSQLKKLTLTVDTEANCAASSASTTANTPWQNADFCTVFRGSPNGVCVSDRGGPFIVDGRIVGMIKYFSCGSPAQDVFAELTPDIISWIQTEAA